MPPAVSWEALRAPEMEMGGPAAIHSPGTAGLQAPPGEPSSRRAGGAPPQGMAGPAAAGQEPPAARRRARSATLGSAQP